jgi:hypothetical protein
MHCNNSIYLNNCNYKNYDKPNKFYPKNILSINLDDIELSNELI